MRQQKHRNFQGCWKFLCFCWRIQRRGHKLEFFWASKCYLKRRCVKKTGHAHGGGVWSRGGVPGAFYFVAASCTITITNVLLPLYLRTHGQPVCALLLQLRLAPAPCPRPVLPTTGAHLPQPVLQQPPSRTPPLWKARDPTTAINPRPLSQVNPRPLSQVNPRPLSQVNPRPLSQVNPRPLSQVNPRPLSPINPRPLSQVNPRPLSQVNPRPLSPINPRPLSPINPRPLSPINDLYTPHQYWSASSINP